MLSRFLAAAVALFAGSFAAPVTASAEETFGGGLAFHPGIRPYSPAVVHAPSFARGHVGPHGIGLHRSGLHRFAQWPDVPGTRWWWWTGLDEIGPYAYDYPPYAQSGGAPAGERQAPPPPAAAEGRPQAVTIYRSGCRTQTQTVPSEFAGTRTINIIRCY
jgi:hypothetical protein